MRAPSCWLSVAVCVLSITGCATHEEASILQAESLSVNQLRLVDNQGRVRMILDAAGSEGPSIVLLDSDAKRVMELSDRGSSGPSIIIRDTTGIPQLEVGADPTGERFRIVLTQPGNRGRVEMIAEADGYVGVRTVLDGTGTVALGGKPGDAPGMAVHGPQGDCRVAVGANGEGTAFVTVYEADGGQKVVMSAGATGPSGVGVYDRKSQARATLAATEGGDSFVAVHGLDGGQRANLYSSESGPSGLGIYGKDLKSRVSLSAVQGGDAYLLLFGADGEPRVNLLVRDPGPSGLEVADKNSQRRVLLGTFEGEDAYLVLTGVDGAERVNLLASETRISGMNVWDFQSRGRVHLGFDPTNNLGFLRVLSPKLGSEFEVVLDGDGTGTAGLGSKETNSEIMFRCHKGKEPGFRILSDARERLRLSVDAAGDTVLWAGDEKGRMQWQVPK